MTAIKCIIANCKSEFEVEDAAAVPRYLCSSHTRQEQYEALGRRFVPEYDWTDRDVRFQEFQFDPFFGGTVGVIAAEPLELEPDTEKETTEVAA